MSGCYVTLFKSREFHENQSLKNLENFRGTKQ